MSKDLPLVSVVIPLYNCEAYIDKCIESIVHQTYPSLEILISDDCSLDHSAEKVKNWLSKDSRIVFFQQPTNIGLVKNYNFLFEKAKGDYITIQDSDDWSEYYRIEKQMDIFLSDGLSEYGVVGGLRVFHYPYNVVKHISKGHDIIIEGSTFDYHFCPASYMFRRSILNQIPGLDLYFEGGTSMDRYFINLILSKYKGYCINQFLYHHNVRPNSNHKTFSEKKITTAFLCEELIRQRIEFNSDWLQEKQYDKISQFEREILNDKEKLSEAYRSAAVFEIEFRLYKKAFMLLRKSFSYDITPLNIKTGFYLFRSFLFSKLR